MEPDTEKRLAQSCRISIPGFEEIREQSDIPPLLSSFTVIREVLEMPEIELKEMPPTAFFVPGEKVAEIESSDSPEEEKCSSDSFPAFDAESFSVIPTDRKTVLLAKQYGYLLIGDGFSLISPVNSEDRFLLRFRFLPVRHGRDALMEYYQAYCREHQRRYPEANVSIKEQEDLEQIPSHLVFEETIVTGVKPQEGRDAEIKLYLEKASTTENNDGPIDYHDFHNYIMVREGDLLGEKIFQDSGREGVDIYGKRVPVTAGKDKVFQAGDNVITETTEEKCLYKAAITGIVNLKDTSISLSKAMMVDKDVCFATGNIIFDGDVVIKGSVKNGFQVKTFGNLIIGGAVEAGVRIQCDGNLNIKGGVLGEQTVVWVKGDSHIGFVQDARIYCEGSLVVRKNLLNADVFCNRNLAVLGEGHKDNSASVIGGKYYSMQGIEAKSVGSYTRETMFVSGYNPYAEMALKDIVTAIKTLELQIAKTVESIGFDIHSPDAIEKITKIPPYQRQRLKMHLVTLKQFTSKREKLLEQEKVRREEMYQKDIGLMQILIKGQLIPEVIIQLHGITKIIKEKNRKVSFVLDESEIRMKSL